MLFRRRRADSSQSLPRGKGAANNKTAPRLPPPQRCKSILRVTNVDDSLHSIYGSSRRDSDQSMRSTKSEPTPRSRNVVLSTIEIREYARTVGDNPSCSSGPPVAYVFQMHLSVFCCKSMR
jgi:hypothetical protein